MKTRLAILAVLAATAGASTGAFAQGIDETDPSAILAPVAPVIKEDVYDPAEKTLLYATEQSAFKGLEVATQIVEAGALQNGCLTKEYDLKVVATLNGAKLPVGKVYLDGVTLDVAAGEYGPYGRTYKITGGGDLGDYTVAGVDATGSYSFGSAIQEVSTSFTMTSDNDGADTFAGTIIKDYARPVALKEIPAGFTSTPKKVSTLVDYGYQQIKKNGYPHAKYWQQSQSWRQNGAKAGTWWVKNRVAPEGGCTIEVWLEGTSGKANQDNSSGFNETGYISVNRLGEQEPLKR